MRHLLFLACSVLLAGCGDDGDSGGANAADVSAFELRPASPTEQEGYAPMRVVAGGSRFAYYVAQAPVVTLSDFAAAEVQTLEEGSKRLVTATLSEAAARKLVKDWKAGQRWGYAIIVNDQLRGILQIGRDFDGTVQLRVGKKLAEGIADAISRE